MSIATVSGVQTTFAAPKQVSDANSQGTEVGQSSADLVSFYGQTPITQPTVGPASAFATGTSLNGTLTKYAMTNATTNPGASTTAEVTSTCTGLLAADVVAVNKPTATAGIGIAGYRVSAANAIGITYSNISSGAITTTAEAYDVLGISSAFTTTAVLSPASVPSLGGNEQTFSVAGATVGSLAIVNKPTAQAGLGISNIRVTSPGQVAITFLNNSSGAITPTAAETYSFAFLPNLAPSSNSMTYKVAQATTAIAASSASEITTAVTGILANDIITGVSKPTIQAGLGVVGYRVTSAGNIGIQMMEVSSAVTTTLETYSVSVQRLQPVAPFSITSAALTPVSVAAGTTAEQTFTVNSLNASTSVFVNKPSYTSGLHVVNARVSAASTLAITYQNDTAAAIVPPAETYLIGALNIQGPGQSAVTTAGSTTNAIIVGVSAPTSAVMDLRTALQNLGLMGTK